MILLASVLSGILGMCPNRERRRAWTIGLMGVRNTHKLDYDIVHNKQEATDFYSYTVVHCELWCNVMLSQKL